MLRPLLLSSLAALAASCAAAAQPETGQDTETALRQGPPATAARAVPRRPRQAAVVMPPERPGDLPIAPSTEEPAAVPAAELSPEPRAAVADVPVPPLRPALPGDGPVAAEPAAAPSPARGLFAALFAPATPSLVPPVDESVVSGRPHLDRLIAHHARLNGVPESLVHRIVVRESKYNPRAVGRGGAMGLMQIKTGTARALGYEGGPSGLLDAETNITYAVKYLAGAYRTAGGNHDRAVMNYARGYYYEARRQGLTASGERRGQPRLREADATASLPAAPEPARGWPAPDTGRDGR